MPRGLSSSGGCKIGVLLDYVRSAISLCGNAGHFNYVDFFSGNEFPKILSICVELGRY